MKRISREIFIYEFPVSKIKLNFSLFSKLRDQNIFLLYNTFPSYGII